MHLTHRTLLQVAGASLVLSDLAPRRIWASGPDQDQTIAAATRTRLQDQVSVDQMRLIGYHLPDGGMGHAERHGDGNRFVPENAGQTSH